MPNNNQPTASEQHQKLSEQFDRLAIDLFNLAAQRKALDEEIAAKEATRNNIRHLLDGAQLGAAVIKEVEAAQTQTYQEPVEPPKPQKASK